MGDSPRVIKPEAVEISLEEMKIKSGSPSGDERSHSPDQTVNTGILETSTLTTPPELLSVPSTLPRQFEASTPPTPEVPAKPYSEVESDGDKIFKGEVSEGMSPEKPAKLSRASSRKIVARPPPLFDHLPDDTSAAKATFEVIPGCLYGSKYMGSSDQEALGCECSEEWSESGCVPWRLRCVSAWVTDCISFYRWLNECGLW